MEAINSLDTPKDKIKAKIFFVGNPLGGDDGIGPHLFKEFEHDIALKEFELNELGVLGIDLIDVLEPNDNIIIIDAVFTDDESLVGNVVNIPVNNLSSNLRTLSLHDFGIEQTITLIKAHIDDIGYIKVIGIYVKNIEELNLELSDEIKNKFAEIKTKVLELILS